MPESTEPVGGKNRKRPAVKAAASVATGKVKATIHLSGDADKRLGVHATMMEMDRSALVEHLIVTHLKRWVVSDRQRDGAGEAEG